LYLAVNFQEGRHLSVKLQNLPEAGFKFGEAGHFTKFAPGSNAGADRDRHRLPYLSRQRFKFLRDTQRLFRASKIE
jgi:hypothetical protein